MVIGNTWFIDTLSIGFIAQFLYFIYTWLLGTFILFGMFLPVHKLSLFALFIHGYLVHFILFWHVFAWAQTVGTMPATIGREAVWHNVALR